MPGPQRSQSPDDSAVHTINLSSEMPMQLLNEINQTRTTGLPSPDDGIQFIGRSDTESGLRVSHGRRTASLRPIAVNQALYLPQQNASSATGQPTVQRRGLESGPLTSWNIFAALVIFNLLFRVFFATSLAGVGPSLHGINLGYMIGIILSLFITTFFCMDIAQRIMERH